MSDKRPILTTRRVSDDMTKQAPLIDGALVHP